MAKKDKTANELVADRKKLRAKGDNLKKRKEDGKVTILGNLRRKRNKKKQEKNQDAINNNAQAQSWRNKKKKEGQKKESENIKTKDNTRDEMRDMIKKKRKKRRKFHPPLKKKTGGFRDTFLEPGIESID